MNAVNKPVRMVWVLVIVNLIFLNTGCGFVAGVLLGIGEHTFPVSAQRSSIILSEKTKVIDEKNSLKIKEIKEDQVILSTSEQNELPKEGEILIGTQGEQSFLRKVTEVKTEKNQITVLTEPATLVEAFDELVIAGLKKEDIQQDGFSAKFQKFVVDNKYKEGYIYKKNIQQTLDLGYGIKADASIDFDIDFGSDAEIHIEITKGRNFIRFAPKGTLTLRVTLKTEKKLTLLNKRLEQHIPIPTIGPFMVGPVPIFITIDPKIALELTANTQGSITFGGIEVSIPFQAGIEVENGRGKVINIFTPQPRFIKPSVHLSAEAKATLHVLETDIAVLVADIAGPYVTIDPYLKTALNMGINHCTASASMGIAGRAGFKAEISLKRFNIPVSVGGKLDALELFDKEKNIYTNDNFCQGKYSSIDTIVPPPSNGTIPGLPVHGDRPTPSPPPTPSPSLPEHATITFFHVDGEYYLVNEQARKSQRFTGSVAAQTHGNDPSKATKRNLLVEYPAISGFIYVKRETIVKEANGPDIYILRNQTRHYIKSSKAATDNHIDISNPLPIDYDELSRYMLGEPIEETQTNSGTKTGSIHLIVD